jgi:hypothetical protein
MIYVYSRSASKSKVTVSYETFDSFITYRKFTLRDPIFLQDKYDYLHRSFLYLIKLLFVD